MTKQVTLDNQLVTYTLRRSVRARRMRLAVARGGAVTVTVPFRFQENLAERFILEKASWLLSKIRLMSKFSDTPMTRHSRPEYLKHKEHAREVITAIVNQYSTEHGFQYNSISIRNQKTCWGSCSRKGNLNFNYKVLWLPERTQAYIVVHELCHLQEMNHSKRFWKSVADIIPEYREVKKSLRAFGVR